MPSTFYTNKYISTFKQYIIKQNLISLSGAAHKDNIQTIQMLNHIIVGILCSICRSLNSKEYLLSLVFSTSLE